MLKHAAGGVFHNKKKGERLLNKKREREKLSHPLLKTGFVTPD